MLCYLTDEDLITFLKNSIQNLENNGMIFIKENVSDEDLPVFDESDNSMVRSKKAFEEIFAEAGLKIISHEY